jgi:CheY-like chemotaxis protein
MTASQILIAHTEPQTLQSLEQIFTDCQLIPLAAHTVNQAQQILSTQPVILTLCERNLPAGGYGELLRWGKDRGISTPLVVSSRSIDESEYLEAMQRGAFDYIAPPYQRTDIELILRRRREPRRDVILPVQVYGTNADGLPFLQFANTHNISSEGARLCGLNHKCEPGTVIGVRCHEKGGHFRVVWVRKSGSESYEIGVHNLTPGHAIWGLVGVRYGDGKSPEPEIDSSGGLMVETPPRDLCPN